MLTAEAIRQLEQLSLADRQAQSMEFTKRESELTREGKLWTPEHQQLEASQAVVRLIQQRDWYKDGYERWRAAKVVLLVLAPVILTGIVLLVREALKAQ